MRRYRDLAPILAMVSTTGCSYFATPPGETFALAAPNEIPHVSIDLGTVDVGDVKDFRASFPIDDRVKNLFTPDSTIRPNCDNLELSWAGGGSGYMMVSGFTHHLSNCDGFGTTASVVRDGKETATLSLHLKVRRAFQIEPIKDGSRYSMQITKGFGLPVVVDHSQGIKATLKQTGPQSAELELHRLKPALVPGGMIRLIDWKSRDSQVVMLPLPSVSSSMTTTGNFLDQEGKMTITEDTESTSKKRNEEVILDPPNAYNLLSQGYKNGHLVLTLQSATRTPSDLTVGIKSEGKWVDIERFVADLPPK